MTQGFATDILIVGGGVGACAAALAATAMGYRVLMTEPTDWLGGQFTAQGVPPDEHRWIERFGCTRRYDRFRQRVRGYYRRNYRLTQAAQRDVHLNPGQGWVSALCAEPRSYLAALHEMLAPAMAAGRLIVWLNHEPVSAEVDHDWVQSITLRDRHRATFKEVTARYFLDATELGDLLPLTGTEYVTGAESKSATGEPHAKGAAQPDNMQAITWVFAMGHDASCRDDRYRIDKPTQYDYWRSYVPQITPAWSGPLLRLTYCNPISLQPRNLPLFAERDDALAWFTYRQIIDHRQHRAGNIPDDVSLVNWPQNDYLDGNLINVTDTECQRHLEAARQLSLSWFYWMQTELDELGLYLRPDVMGTEDGLAKAPYIRESRRIRARFTVTENHVGVDARKAAGVQPLRPERFADSVGIGYYRIDLHPSTGGDNYIDVASLPFQIPLGSLIPQRMRNVLPACKNIGSTHITNGCYRLHPIEWNIGEACGLLAAYCLQQSVQPHQVYESHPLMTDFQRVLVQHGVELAWPNAVIDEVAAGSK